MNRSHTQYLKAVCASTALALVGAFWVTAPPARAGTTIPVDTTDAALLSAQGKPSLLFGTAGAGAHAAEGWVDLAGY